MNSLPTDLFEFPQMPPTPEPSEVEQAQITPSQMPPTPDVSEEPDEIQPNKLEFTEDETDDSFDPDDPDAGEYHDIKVNRHDDAGDPAFITNEIIARRLGRKIPQELVGIYDTNWFGTHNHTGSVEFEDIQDFIEANKELFQYVVFFEEYAPTTGHRHYHSLVILSKRKSAHTVVRMEPYGSWEKCRQSAVVCYRYISKDNRRVFEYGIPPAAIEREINRQATDGDNDHNRRRQNPALETPADRRFRALYERALQHDTTIEASPIYARHRAYFDNILARTFVTERYDGELVAKNLWIMGPPGTGKTRLVWDYKDSFNLRIYPKNTNKWWDGYDGQQIVLIDDADPNNMKYLAGHMKNWSDRYSFLAEVKGGSRMVNCMDYNLIVTSNYSIEECFNKTDAEALLRRFDVLVLE